MSVRNLIHLLQPTSIALIGASQRPGSVGNLLARNLTSGGFKGSLWAVNPKYEEVIGLTCYSDVNRLPQAPDLAVLVTPSRTLPRLIRQLGKRGCRAVIILSANLAALDQRQQRKLQRSLLKTAQPFNLRILGPGGLGLIVPHAGVNASLAHLQPQPGNIALLTQSGAMLTALIDWAVDHDIGFSCLASLGDRADVDFADILNYLAEDSHTAAVLLYLETISQARKFMSAARAAARMKPVIVLKGGRHGLAKQGTDDAVYDAAFERAGLLRVASIPELFDMTAILAHGQTRHGANLAIVTNDRGLGVLASDALVEEEGSLAKFSEATGKQLDKNLPRLQRRSKTHTNPLDLGSTAASEHYATALNVLAQDLNIDATVVLHCPVATVASRDVAEAVVAVARTSSKPLLSSWVGSRSVGAARTLFAQSHIPSYESPAEAVRAFMQTVRYRRNQELLMETPPSIPDDFRCDTDTATALIDTALAEKRSRLGYEEISTLLTAYAIPSVAGRRAADPDEAAGIAAEFGKPVALKMISDDMTRKPEIGSLVHDLIGPEQVRLTALGMLMQLRQHLPKARQQGFIVEPMIHWPHAHKLLLGVRNDSLFGPLLVFGHGGSAAAIINDMALALPPLNLKLARDLIERTHVARLLRNRRPAAAIDAIALTLVKLSQLICEQPYVAELSINPLLVAAKGVLALDCQVQIKPSVVAGPARLAIRPYPKELERNVKLADGQRFLLRPIRAEDEPGLVDHFKRLNAAEIRLRFHHPLKVMEHKLAARLSQLDYDREMALILTDPRSNGAIHGVVRLSADPDKRQAEFAIIVSHYLTGYGLGQRLMEAIIDYARDQGIGELYGLVLAENEAMLALCRKLGFGVDASGDEPGEVIVRLRLFDVEDEKITTRSPIS